MVFTPTGPHTLYNPRKVPHTPCPEHPWPRKNSPVVLCLNPPLSRLFKPSAMCLPLKPSVAEAHFKTPTVSPFCFLSDSRSMLKGDQSDQTQMLLITEGSDFNKHLFPSQLYYSTHLLWQYIVVLAALSIHTVCNTQRTYLCLLIAHIRVKQLLKLITYPQSERVLHFLSPWALSFPSLHRDSKSMWQPFFNLFCMYTYKSFFPC